MNVAVIGNLQYQGFGGGNVVQSIAAQATYTALQSGVVDIPSGTAAGSVFPLPMGGVATGKGYMVKANSSVMLGVNGGTGTAQMQGIATGGYVFALGPLPGKQQAVVSLVVVVPAGNNVGNDGSVEYLVFGD